jgi:dTDP-4-dehydrorhamnose reductase
VRKLELWGGVECTVNRVGETYSDQVCRSGHHDRPDDIALVASTGIKTLRYPVLWERVAPDGLIGADWSWTDDRLDRLRRLGIRPIAGLLHHGSGPTFRVSSPSTPGRSRGATRGSTSTRPSTNR